MNEFDNNEFVEYDLDNFASDNKKTAKATHSAGPMLNLSKILKFAIPAVAVLTVLIIVLTVCLTPKNKYFGYMKDGEMFLTTVKDGAGEQITQDFLIDDGSSSTSISDYTRMSNNGKKIFFIDKYDGTSRNLYYKNVDDKDEKSYKLSSDVDYFDINDKGTIVTYIKDDVDLFQHDLTEQSDKIDTDVTYFVSSNNGKKVLYYKENTESEQKTKDLYLYVQGKDTERIVKNVESVRYISEDFTTIYYTSDAVLYKLDIGKSSSKISDSVREVVKVYDSGEVYFSKVTDENDATLYYYNGKKSTAVLKNYYRTESLASENPVLVVNCTESDKMTYNVVIKDKATKIKHEVVTVNLNDAGSEIYILADTDTQTTLPALFYAEINKELKKFNKVSDDVAYGKYVSEDVYVYLKDYDYEEGCGTLYSSEKKIAEKVYWNYMKYSESDKLLFFFTDKKDNNGKLNCFDNGKIKTVMDDVRLDSINVTNTDDVLFLHDFKNGEGILYTYEKGKSVKIDHDVSKIIVITSNDAYDLLAKSYF